ncbi:MAG TPA: helix-turn-helix domain-containing protein, partial [Luteitalea sp.]|nr:helix-turn-helix domain-containing protein [Luteitalea sp.]
MRATTSEIIREAASELTQDLDVLVDDVSRAIADELPEVLDGDSYRASNRANLSLKLSVLCRGSDLSVETAPHEAVVYARDLARRGADLSVLLRAYDLGHQLFWGEWTRRCSARTSDPSVLAELFDVSAKFLFSYFDTVPALVTDAYRQELRSRTDTQEARRTAAVCALLGAATGDVRAIGVELDYPLLGIRHLAVIHDVPDDRALRPVRRLARTIGAGILVVRAETQRTWGWIGLPPTLSDATLEEHLTRLDGGGSGTLAVGDIGAGVEGFRDSHREAELALRHAQSGGAGSVVRYRDLGAVSLLASDTRRARRFVEHELGALAAPNAAASRARATARVFLQENCNRARTARRLGVHYNTVAYKLKAAEALLGRPLTHRRFDLEAALLLH